MNPGPMEVLLISFFSLLVAAIPLATLIGVIYIYIKLARIEKRLEQLEKRDQIDD